MVVSQTDVVLTLKDLKVEMGRQTCKWVREVPDPVWRSKWRMFETVENLPGQGEQKGIS